MKCIIAGTRSCPKYIFDIAMKKCDFVDEITLVISGAAEGADKHGEIWADGRDLPVSRHPAYWLKYGKSAGPIRNKEMLKKADALIAIWNGKSKGTLDMINISKKKGIKVFVYEYEEDKD
jgi:hypothetical protein